jgi:hypothetical protein
MCHCTTTSVWHRCSQYQSLKKSTVEKELKSKIATMNTNFTEQLTLLTERLELQEAKLQHYTIVIGALLLFLLFLTAVLATRGPERAPSIPHVRKRTRSVGDSSSEPITSSSLTQPMLPLAPVEKKASPVPKRAALDALQADRPSSTRSAPARSAISKRR